MPHVITVRWRAMSRSSTKGRLVDADAAVLAREYGLNETLALVLMDSPNRRHVCCHQLMT